MISEALIESKGKNKEQTAESIQLNPACLMYIFNLYVLDVWFFSVLSS